jgi:putative transposase
VLRAANLQHRRGSARPPVHRPRQHVADGPWQVALWDITYLPSHTRRAFFYFYLVEDVWSRKVLGFAVHEVESAEHAAALVERIGSTPTTRTSAAGGCTPTTAAP